jgi:hypothetical protein
MRTKYFFQIVTRMMVALLFATILAGCEDQPTSQTGTNQNVPANTPAPQLTPIAADTPFVSTPTVAANVPPSPSLAAKPASTVATATPNLPPTTGNQPAGATATPPYQLAGPGPIPTFVPPENFSPMAGMCSAASVTTVSSLEELIAKANLVVSGKVTSTGEIIKDENTPRQATETGIPIYIDFLQVYHFEVEHYYKGEGSKILNVAQMEGFIQVGGLEPGENIVHTIPVTQLRIDGSKQQWSAHRFSFGKKYLLFLSRLEPQTAYPGNTYFSGRESPWRYILPDAGNIIDDPATCGVPFDPFPPQSSANFLKQVEEVAKKNPTIPPPTPTPTAEPIPTPRFKAGQTVNVVRLYGLDRAEGIMILGPPVKDFYIRDPEKIKNILNILDKDLKVLPSPTRNPNEADPLMVAFIINNMKGPLFDYNKAAGTFSFRYLDYITIAAPPELIKALGLS